MNKRLREEFAKLQVEINEEKSRIVDLDRAESFGFLGFDFRRLRSMKGQVWRAHYTPKVKKRTALLRKLKDVFRRYQSQPVDQVVQLINPVLRGWVNYFAVGHGNSIAFASDRSPATLVTSPAPATSNAACGFSALRFPVCFMPEVMGPITLGVLSAQMHDEPDSRGTASVPRTASAYSTSSSRSPGDSGIAHVTPDLLFYPVFDETEALAGAPTKEVLDFLDILYPPNFGCLGGNWSFSTATGHSAQNPCRGGF